MNAVVLKGHGDFDKLEYITNFTTPSPKENEVLVQIKAAAINNTDINTRVGWYSKSSDTDDASWSGHSLKFPRIQGADICGYIVDVGKNVSKNRIGQRVLIEPCINENNGEKLDSSWYVGSECDGGFAQYTVITSKYAHKIQSDYSDFELATFPCSYSTAENLLTKANVSKEDVVLVSGASGGVGSAVIQLAISRGAKVIAITSEKKVDDIKKLGAYKTVLRDENLVEELKENSVDVVIDLVAGDKFKDFLDVLRPKGRYAVSGAIGGAIVELDVRTLYLKDLTLIGCTVLEDDVFSNLIKKIQTKQIKPLVSKIYDLKDIVKAQQEFLKKKHIGKIVLKID